MPDTPAPPETRREPQAMLAREVRFAPSTFDAEARTVEVVFTTGADVLRRDWWTGEQYIERLEVSEAAVDLSRLNAGAAVLDSHSSWALRDVIGVVERAWIEGGEGRALIRFSEREDVKPIVEDVRNGILRNISAGYWVSSWEVTEATASSPKIKTAKRWQPGEISFVPVPADAGAQVRAADAPARSRATTPESTPGRDAAHNQEGRMADTPKPGTDAPGNTTPETRAEPAKATLQDLQGLAKRGGLDSDWIVQQLAAGVTLDAARDAVIDAQAARRAPPTQPSGAAIIGDEGDKVRRALSDALLHRCGLLRDEKGMLVPVPEHARHYRGFRMIDFAAESIRIAGGNTRGLMPAEIARAALGQREFMSRAGIGLHSVSDFSNLLANTASKALGVGYTSARRTFTLWARRRTLPDFKDFRVVNLSGAPTLEQISPTGADAGEITFGTIGEGAETYRLARYGRRVAVSFEAIVNDDMDGFSRVPQMFGAAAGRLESVVVVGILNSNPNMADSTALFAAGHNNIFGNGVSGFSAGDGVLNVTGLGVGRRVMRTQTAPNGDILDLEPQFLLVPAALEAAALQFTSQSYVASAPGNMNPFASTLTPIVEPRLASATQWYLIASNDQVDTVEYGYLEGMEAPQVTTYTDEDTDGAVVKCTHSFGAKATDWRGMARASGT
jgi:hypothetical protein